MMLNELIKRIITSIFLITLLGLSFFFSYILIILLILITVITWIEFNHLLIKIFKKENLQFNLLRILFKVLSLIYLIFFSIFIFQGITISEPIFKLDMIYLFSICVFSDVGGLMFGKIFKGKKLTSISPNKTISGSIGSFIMSLILVPFYYFFTVKFDNFFYLIILTILVSLACQLGDLFISYLKRKANVKDTSNLLPGHGGFLDRIDGILFAIPLGMIMWKFPILII